MAEGKKWLFCKGNADIFGSSLNKQQYGILYDLFKWAFVIYYTSVFKRTRQSYIKNRKGK